MAIQQALNEEHGTPLLEQPNEWDEVLVPTLSPDDKEDKAKLGSKYCSHHAKRSVIPTENLRRRKQRPADVNVKLFCNQLQSDGQQPE